MIELGATGVQYSPGAATSGRTTVRATDNPARPLALRQQEAFIVRSDDIPPGFGWYLIARAGCGSGLDLSSARVATLPSKLSYIAEGDVLRLVPDKKSLRVLFRRSAANNSFLLTERCNNYCLMCSQPPRNVNDRWIVDEMQEVLRLIDADAREISFTGGEPTLLGDDFFDLVRTCTSYLPRTALHILSLSYS